MMRGVRHLIFRMWGEVGVEGEGRGWTGLRGMIDLTGTGVIDWSDWRGKIGWTGVIGGMIGMRRLVRSSWWAFRKTLV